MVKQAIDFLFSPYRRQVLALLYMRPDESFHVRELERLTGISAGSLHRELKAMAAAGLLTRAKQGNQVLYQADMSCEIFEEIAAIFRKTIGLRVLLEESLASVADRISFAFVFGSVAAGTQHKESDLDICVLGELKLIDVMKALSGAQRTISREINPVVMTTTQFAEALEKNERFAQRVFNEPKVFVIGEENEFRKLAENRPKSGKFIDVDVNDL